MANAESAVQRPPIPSAQSQISVGVLGSNRLLGVDLLRAASLLSIVFFHIVLRDSRFAAATGARDTSFFDALLCVSSVFDNRSMALLSLFLLLRRPSGAPYAAVMRARAHRLLLPYLAWTLIYPFLDLGIAAMAGQPQTAMAHILDLRFWLSGVLLATTTGHLHFLPTLFVLTLLLPLYRTRAPIWATILAIASASALRTVVEFLVLHTGNITSITALMALSGARIVEYLPFGFLAFRIARRPISHRIAAAIAALCLLGASIGLQPDLFLSAGPVVGLLAWTIAQAILSAVIVALATCALLAWPVPDPVLGDFAGQTRYRFSQHALGIFLIHPFFCDLFDVFAMAPRAFEAAMVLPKFVFVLACSFATSLFLRRYLKLTAIV